MPYRLTKIYTRKGDEGYTTLGDKPLPKDDLLIEALGTVDELNSVIGFIVSLQIRDKAVETVLTQIQNDLFDLGGELHLPQRAAITAEKVTRLEETLDAWNQTLPPLKEFILPRGTPPSAACHVARTVCRRAERSMVRLHRQVTLENPQILRYLNRLSDLLFVTARRLASENSETELQWQHD
ncbi:Cob(I)yrinic acid a,c-diamide adenosyltransferase [Aquicella siphonis]|uniref:Corrinoid adenosyltransferase n=1 Tax=Aquicella siphonis TaxID=254247 RepID=A0A5E4PE76_9COXI|nr:cob(I)yrinic acid a,c-diamide adenosyltransferase [Aquicella siphonis]VVC75279.1 Cob(I)yrinic acid a,c-diamide adenosyltransferase [Aquicella siphonis]